KSRSDKKDTICKRCDKVCINPNKLREHLRQKNLCRPQTDNQEAIQETIQPSIQIPFQASVQKISQQRILTTEPKPIKVSSKISNKDTLFKNPDIEW
ncbi:18433_t:CDS:1, partial [Funneliformis geosporum]